MLRLGIILALATSLTSCAGTVGNVVDVSSDGPVFIFDGGDAVVAPGTKMAWNDDAFASSVEATEYAEFLCPESSTGGFSFLAERGNEKSPSAWKMNAPLGFRPGSHSLLAPVVTPDWLINGDFAQIKAQGGSYSLGVACVENNGLSASKVFFRSITVTAGTGDWTADPNK
ncbi:hypothetical protein GCM10027022_02140 [Alpinimonas psychrophila]|uniref:Uncharacterized protein n=1 Tax=Alpinimonas psychrophila TaxID=748908 RepID=A0A7W3JRR3_9MICO|nr:hypothetical protein [Alpinimonas psychrophila]MBA8828023.1 hypothetical protein [Alpinimonas psychrophila]